MRAVKGGSVTFCYRGQVRGQGRPRFNKATGAFESREDKAYKRELAAAYLEQVGAMGFGLDQVAVSISVTRCLPGRRPKGMASEPDTYKPDADNIAKAVMDALSGIAYEDDKQVVSLKVIKNDRVRTEDGLDLMEVTVSRANQIGES